MKRFSSLTILMIGILLNVAFAQETLKMQPEKPKPGDKITFTYNTSGTELFGVENPEAYVYLMEGALPLVQQVKLTKSGTSYTGEFKTNDTTKSAFVTFSKDEKRDNNSDKGYYAMMYGADGNPVPGARKSIGIAFGGYGGIWGLKRNLDEAIKWNKDELAANPSIKKEKPLEVISLLSNSKEEADMNEMKIALAAAVADPAATEADLTSAKYSYLGKFKDKEKAAEIDSLIKKKFPKGAWLKNESIEKFYAEKDLVKKDELYQAMKKEALTEADKKALGNYAYALAVAYGNAGNLEKAKQLALDIKEKSMLASAYNSIAWKETGESVDGKPGNVAVAKELSAKSLELVKAAEEDMSAKPSYYTAEQWKKMQAGTYSMYADTYALLLYHSKEYQKAYDIQKKAVEDAKSADASMNESFAVYTEKVKGPKVAKTELESFIRDGKYSPKMKTQLKKLYLAEKNSEASWDTYLAGLQAESIAKQKAEVAKKMINESAPAFVLKDIKGEEVTLASLKGKVVVVDFWATWCGPCKASFPGMKMAVEKFKDDKNVKFVFIDTWENGEKDEVMKNVSEFISKNAYPFHVLMDTDGKIVSSYGVEGIPTKFVIDPNSQIRFRSIGFSGSADGLATELGLMIEMAKGGETGGSDKKAF